MEGIAKRHNDGLSMLSPPRNRNYPGGDSAGGSGLDTSER
jgi:hypothetical protein